MAGGREWRGEGGRILKPRKVEYELGKDVHGRTVILIFEATGHGNPSWTIRSLSANQRDEGWVVMGLTRENLLAMAEAVKDAK